MKAKKGQGNEHIYTHEKNTDFCITMNPHYINNYNDFMSYNIQCWYASSDFVSSEEYLRPPRSLNDIPEKKIAYNAKKIVGKMRIYIILQRQG